MDDSNPDNYIEESFGLTWKDHIERASAGDTGATREVMHAFIRFLEEMHWGFNPRDRDSRIRIYRKGRSPRGYVPEPLCTFLIERLEAAMSAPKKRVGEAMGMGNPPRHPQNSKRSKEFLDQYSSAVGGRYPVEPSKHPEILKSIAKRMKLSLRSVQRYWKTCEPLVKESGLPHPKYERNKYVYEDLAIIINHYRLRENTPLRHGNTSRPLPREDMIKKIASDLNEDPHRVARYCDAFDYTVKEHFRVSENGLTDKELLEDLANFINSYHSLTNSGVCSKISVYQSDEEDLKRLASTIGKDLSSLEHYLYFFQCAAEEILGLPVK